MSRLEKFLGKIREGNEGEFYYCDNIREHPFSEIIQIKTKQRIITGEHPRCPYCRKIMTYGRYW